MTTTQSPSLRDGGWQASRSEPPGQFWDRIAEDLARQSSVSLRTIRRAEISDAQTSMTVANEEAIRRTLEAAGVEFIDENGGGPGVRLRKRQAKRA